MRTLMKMLLLIPVLCFAVETRAHDTWVEAGSLTTRTGEYVYVDLRLGNHGNNHRDFKLASKITLAPCSLSVTAPDGLSIDLKSRLVDTGNAPKEGYWTARYVADKPGVYEALHKLDTLHGTVRAIKSSKTYFVATDNGRLSPGLPGLENIRTHGLGLEFVLKTPIDELAAGRAFRLQLLRNGKPLGNVPVAFVPRGVQLSEGPDANYERTTDAQGMVEFSLAEGNILLAVAHFVEVGEKGEGYDKTHYGATMVLHVPQKPLRW